MSEVEIWKDIPGYENKYRVSNYGRLQTNYWGKGWKFLNPKPRKKDGYVVCGLRKKGKLKGYLLHRLVMLAFVGKCPDDQEVDHINKVRSDNRLENLQYLTHADHIVKDLANKSQKLQPYDVWTIRWKLYQGQSQKSIAKEMGISRGTVSDIRLNRIWKSLK